MTSFGPILSLFFIAVGAVLLGTGFLMPEARAPLATANVNVYAGVMMVVFGGGVWFLTRQKS